VEKPDNGYPLARLSIKFWREFMKKVLMAIFALMMVSSTAMAQKSVAQDVSTATTSTMSDDSTGSWVLQADGGLGVMASSDNGVTFSGIGYSMEGSLGYNFSKAFSLSLSIGYDSYGINGAVSPYNGIYQSYMPLQLVGKFNLGGSDFSPYFTLGGGIAKNTFEFDGTSEGIDYAERFSEMDFILSPGLGVAFPLAAKSQFFVQARADIDFISNTYSGFFGGPTHISSPLIFIPIQAGVNFDVK
jgi:hypothetical protein